PGRQIPDEPVANACSLIVTSLEVATFVPWIIKLEGFHFFDRVCFELQEAWHWMIEHLLHHRLEAGVHDDFFTCFLQYLEGFDMRVPVRSGHDPIQVIVTVD